MTELGEIPQEWEVEKMGDISEIIMGQSPTGESYNDSGDGIPLLNGPTEFGHKYPTPKQWTTKPTKFSKKNDVLFCVRGSSTGRMNFADSEYCIGRGLAAIRGIEGNSDTRFIYYGIQFNLSSILNLSAGSTFPNVGREDLKNVLFAVPVINEQQKIADILSTFDQQIEQTDALIEKTKELKKGLMQKLLTKGIGNTEFRDTEIGRIPKGWDVKRLGEIVQICYGKNQKEVEAPNGKYKILGTGGIIGNTNAYLWDKPSVLIGRKGTIDKPMYIEEPFWTVDTLFYTKVNEGYVAKWLYYYLNKIDLKKYNEATGVPSLSVAVLNTILILVPPFKEQQKISKILSAVDSDIDINESKKNKLENAKKALMNHLLTGKIRVLVQ